MIKFFRKIRRELIIDNKISKYLIYAIGEIILIMIGILLALQVNNLNNERTHRKQEIKYLLNLKADLQEDLINLKAFIEDKKVKYNSALKILEMSTPENASELRRMDSIIWQVFRWRSFNPSTNTLDELIGSGNLSLIKNDSIKTMMLNIQHSNKLVAGINEHMRREYDHYLYDRSASLRELSPFLDFEQLVKENAISFKLSTNETSVNILIDQANALLNDLAFRNGLKFAIMNNQRLRIGCDNLYLDLLQLVELINQELNKELKLKE
jgi:Family of unknown function (DUF6090)